MRVISQNGAIDVPYNLTAFHSCNGRIRMYMVGDTGMGTEMAVYSSQEKALRVLENMRSLDYQIKFSEIIGDVREFGSNEYRFPLDDEVIA